MIFWKSETLLASSNLDYFRQAKKKKLVNTLLGNCGWVHKTIVALHEKP